MVLSRSVERDCVGDSVGAVFYRNLAEIDHQDSRLKASAGAFFLGLLPISDQNPVFADRKSVFVLFSNENAPRCAANFCILVNTNETQRSSATLSGMSGHQNQKGASRWRR